MKVKRTLLLLLLITFVSSVHATLTGLETTLIDICNFLMDLIPTVAFLLVATASLAYLIGSMLPSNERARAQVWAMSCLMGAFIGTVMYLVIPTILGALIKASGADVDLTGVPLNGTCGNKIREILSP